MDRALWHSGREQRRVSKFRLQDGRLQAVARYDHGSQYMSDYFQAIRTLKEQLSWAQTFDTCCP